jgi:hypothetical protein
MKIGLDSSFIIDLLARDAPRHAATLASFKQLRDGAEFVLCDHAILESFAVLSRSPKPIGMPAGQAERLLLDNFPKVAIAPLRPGMGWEAIRHTLAHGHWGGRVYDTTIALATYEAGARLLLTWNAKHFHTIAPVGLEVREP